VLTSKKLGDNAQVLALATALGWPYETKRLSFSGLDHFHFRLCGPSLRKVDIGGSSPLAPPWPDLVVTIGRRSTPVALWIRHQSQGKARIVQVGQTRVGFEPFDLVVANPQYHLPAHPRLVRLTLPLLYPKADAIAAAADQWRSRFAHIPRPWTALLVGGSTAPFRFDVAAAHELMTTLKAVLERDGGSVLATTSRRTSSSATAAIQDAMPKQGFFHRWAPHGQENPYLGLLGLADRFVVTGESISMLVEVVRQGKPLAIYPLPMRLRSWRLRIRYLLQDLFLPTPAMEDRQRLGDLLVRWGLLEYRRDFSLFHRQLIEHGRAVWLGAPFPSVSVAPPDELPLVVARIKALFPQVSPT
jgi:hypothetical protein